MKYSFDERCLDLARYFYHNVSDEKLKPLAQLFQDAVENFQDELDAVGSDAT